MKKIAFIILAFFCLLSCEKMEEDSNMLVGKWQLYKYEQETIYASGNIEKSSGTYDGTEYWDFHKDGSVKCTDKKGSIKEYTYSYDKENKVLTIGSDKITVKELSKSSLVTVIESHFIDGTVKPAGVGTYYSYNHWRKIN